MHSSECHTLESNLVHAKNDPIMFENKKSTKSIAKLLVKYHEIFDNYQLSNKVILYLCVKTTLRKTNLCCYLYYVYKTSLCCYFVLRYQTQKSNSNALCKNCYWLNVNINRDETSALQETTQLKPID